MGQAFSDYEKRWQEDRDRQLAELNHTYNEYFRKLQEERDRQLEEMKTQRALEDKIRESLWGSPARE